MNRREFVAGAIALWAPLPLRLRSERFVERWSWVMGQPVHVMLFAESEDAGLEACAAALAELRRVEARLSLFDDASDVCELNRRAGRGPKRVDHDLRDVLRAAEGFRRMTRGAFDPAVEPLMRLWGFHAPRRTAPTATEISAARASVAAAVVQLDGDVVTLPSSHTRLDFGGIGVGYGIDRAVTVLRGMGIRHAFVDVSGDCYGLGAPPGEPAGWPVQIAGTAQTVRLRDSGLATSSNQASVVRWNRLVAGHVMDPETGWPVQRRTQMTIIAAQTIAADALSTGALVAGHAPAGVRIVETNV